MRAVPKSMEGLPAPDHPGLLLDKFVEVVAKQEEQRVELARVVDAFSKANEGTELRRAFDEARARRDRTLRRLSAVSFELETRTPLTIHLARSPALENAGIALHRVYGFPVLPGTGLKGMARAYAERCSQASTDVLRVFGEVSRKDGATAGAVVFHDAWPVAWPKLTVDISNSHHNDYYNGRDAPGDWEEPTPVYFLAVAPRTRFSFALHARDDDGEALRLAEQLVRSALTELGAGAKTASGYGWFAPDERTPVRAKPLERVDLDLVTPAFLAGAGQQGDDCTLRGATVKGLLRWWWRTMHAGFLDPGELRDLEGALWGSTDTGQGLIEVVVEPAKDNARPVRAPYKKLENGRWSSNEAFSKEHGFERDSALAYAAYGMADGSGPNVKHRFVAPPGNRFHVELICAHRGRIRAKKDLLEGRALEIAPALAQAKAALWLLSTYGGIGAKARKGFGSISARDSELGSMTVDAVRDSAKRFREQVGIVRPFNPARLKGAVALGDLACSPLEVQTVWKDPWFAMSEIGGALRKVASNRKHQKDKVALGLPRKIHGPKDEPMKHQDANSHRRPVALTANKGNRHASPVHVCVAPGQQGFVIRTIAFTASLLPDRATSQRVLSAYIKDLGTELRRRSSRSGPKPKPGGTAGVSGQRRGGAGTTPAAGAGASRERPSWAELLSSSEWDRLDGGFVGRLEEISKRGPRFKGSANDAITLYQNEADPVRKKAIALAMKANFGKARDWRTWAEAKNITM